MEDYEHHQREPDHGDREFLVEAERLAEVLRLRELQDQAQRDADGQIDPVRREGLLRLARAIWEAPTEAEALALLTGLRRPPASD